MVRTVPDKKEKNEESVSKMKTDENKIDSSFDFNPDNNCNNIVDKYPMEMETSSQSEEEEEEEEEEIEKVNKLTKLFPVSPPLCTCLGLSSFHKIPTRKQISRSNFEIPPSLDNFLYAYAFEEEYPGCYNSIYMNQFQKDNMEIEILNDLMNL